MDYKEATMTKSSIYIFCLIFVCIGLFADENKAIEPKLEPKNEILEKIKKLKDNEACLLEAPTIIEELGNFAEGWHQMKKFGPNGRDYSIKMAWMPDRKRAFFCGANHQAPHRFNDAWEYDLASNTWVLLYVPDYNDCGKITDYDKETLVLKDGWLRTKKGGPAHPAHTWWGLTYDPNIKGAIWFCAWPNYRLDAKLGAIGADKSQLYNGPPLWVFYPETKKWEPLKTEKPWPRSDAYGASLEYVPDLKKSVFQYGERFILDLENKKWEESSPKGEHVPGESIIYFDELRKQFVAHFGYKENSMTAMTYVAKLENGKILPWAKVLEAENLPRGHDARSMLYYDNHSHKGLLFENDTKFLWAYDPDANTWSKQEPTGEKLSEEHKGRIVSYFDRERNVFVVLGSGWVWCYRHKN